MNIGLILTILAELIFTVMIIYVGYCNIVTFEEEKEKERNRQNLNFENIIYDFEEQG